MAGRGMPSHESVDRRTVLTALGAGTATALAGCSGGGSSSSEGTELLEVGLEGQITGLEPHLANDNIAHDVIYQICDTLVRYNNDGEIVPELAEVTANEDNSEYTVVLEEGVQFHPPVSRELVADDVMYSLERLGQEQAVIQHAASLITNMEKQGDYEVTITLDGPYAPFKSTLAIIGSYILPEEAVEQQGPALGDVQEPVGTGPYVFDEHVQGDHITLTAFEEYRNDDVPTFDEIELRPIPDSDSRGLSLREGSTDFIRRVPFAKRSSLDGRSGVRVAANQDSALVMGLINCANEPWDDPAVRRAVAHLTDRQTVVDTGMFGNGKATYQPLPEGVFGHSELENPREYDTERAQEILSEAGNPLDGRTVTIKSTSQLPSVDATATVWSDTLSSAGIDVEVDNVEVRTMFRDLVQQNFDLLPFNMRGFADPNWYYNELFAEYLNYDSGNQPAADEMFDLIEQGQTATSREERTQAYGELARLGNEHVPWIPIVRLPDLAGMDQSIEGEWRTMQRVNQYWNLTR